MAKKEEFRNVRRSNFTMISNDVINNPELTLQEKGLLAVFLSNSADWTINMKEIIKRSANGRDAHYKMINKLIEHGYFARVEILNEKTNRFKQMVYIFSDNKEDVALALEEYKDNKFAYININKNRSEKQNKTPNTENQETENQYSENQYINNTKSINTNFKNTKDKLNLSIKEEIQKLDLPTIIKTVLQKQIDRLIDFKINIQDIVLHYHNMKDTYTLKEYTYVLNALMTNMEQAPDNFSSVLNNWLKRNHDKQKDIVAGTKPIREEIKPDWLNNKQDVSSNIPEIIDEDFLVKRAQLQAKLKSKYSTKAN